MLNITNEHLHKTNQEGICKVFAAPYSITDHGARVDIYQLFLFQLFIPYFRCPQSESQVVSVLYLAVCPKP